MENINSCESTAKKSLFLDHDYCVANVTCKIEVNKDRLLNRKFTRDTAGTDRSSMRVCTGSERKNIIARDIGINEVHYSFSSEQRIRDKVNEKFGSPSGMGNILSRTVSIFSQSNSEALSNTRKTNLDEIPHTSKAVQLEEVPDLTSPHKRQLDELGDRSRSLETRRSIIDDSRMISIESELRQYSAPNVAFSRNAPIEAQPARCIPPIYPLSDTDQLVTSIVPSNTSIYSQPTQNLSQNSKLPNFRQAFGSMASGFVTKGFQQSSSLVRTSTILENMQITEPGTSDNDSRDSELKHHLTQPSSFLTQNFPLSYSRRGDVNPETQYKIPNSNHSNVIGSTAMNFELMDTQPVTNNEIHCEIPNNGEYPESTPSSLELSDLQRNIALEDLSTPSLSPHFEEQNENIVSKNPQTPINQRGVKRKQESESVWSDMEEFCETELSINDQLMNNGISQSNVASNLCSVSIGTKLAIPECLTPRRRTPDSVSHDHCYDRYTNDQSASKKQKLDDSKPNVSDGKTGEVRFAKKLSGNDINNMRTFEYTRVKKISKQKTSYENKENSTVTTSREYNDSPQRSFLHYNKSLIPQTRQLNLNYTRESDSTQSPKFPTPAEKRVRLHSPQNPSGSSKTQSSAIANRKLTPFYPEGKNANRYALTPFYAEGKNVNRYALTPFYAEGKNINRRTLTPFYADLDETKRCELAPIYYTEENTHQSELQPVRSYRADKEPEVIDISDDLENDKNVKESKNKLTPIYPEKNTEQYALTPYYAFNESTDYTESTQSCPNEKNTELRELTPIYSDRQDEEPDVIDISDDTHNETTVEELKNLTKICSNQERATTAKQLPKILSPVYESPNVKSEVMDISYDTKNKTAAQDFFINRIDNFGNPAAPLNLEMKIERQATLSDTEEKMGNLLTVTNKVPNVHFCSDNDAERILTWATPRSVTSELTTAELFSSYCCEYDHSFPNISTAVIVPFEPILLGNLTDPTDDMIIENIDKALKILETLNDDL